LALASLALAAAGGREPISRAHQLTRQGTSAMLIGDAERSRERLERAVGLVPDFPPALLGLGHLEMSGGRFQAALDHYISAIRGYERLGDRLLDVEYARYSEARATMERLETQIEETETKLDKELTSERPSQARADRLEGRIAAFRAQTQQLSAVHHPRRPAEGGEGTVPGEAYFHLGSALFRLGRYVEAVEAWQACSEKIPEFAPVHHNLALALLQLDRLKEAEASLAQAERLGYDVHPRIKARLRPE
jgi:tetratricopeptide (TPR) repeat protein